MQRWCIINLTCNVDEMATTKLTAAAAADCILLIKSQISLSAQVPHVLMLWELWWPLPYEMYDQLLSNVIKQTRSSSNRVTKGGSLTGEGGPEKCSKCVLVNWAGCESVTFHLKPNNSKVKHPPFGGLAEKFYKIPRPADVKSKHRCEKVQISRPQGCRYVLSRGAPFWQFFS